MTDDEFVRAPVMAELAAFPSRQLVPVLTGGGKKTSRTLTVQLHC